MNPIDRTLFTVEPNGGGYVGTVHLGGRSAKVHVKGSGDAERAWRHAELILAFLQGQPNRVEDSIRDLLLRLDGFSEDTPKGRRRIDRLLSQVGDSDFTCLIHDESALVHLDQPRLVGHVIELQFGSSARLISATIAG